MLTNRGARSLNQLDHQAHIKLKLKAHIPRQLKQQSTCVPCVVTPVCMYV